MNAWGLFLLGPLEARFFLIRRALQQQQALASAVADLYANRIDEPPNCGFLTVHWFSRTSQLAKKDCASLGMPLHCDASAFM